MGGFVFPLPQQVYSVQREIFYTHIHPLSLYYTVEERRTVKDATPLYFIGFLFPPKINALPSRTYFDSTQSIYT